MPQPDEAGRPADITFHTIQIRIPPLYWVLTLIDDETDSTEDELQRRFAKMTFVVTTKKLAQLPHWLKVSEVFKTDSDAPFLKRAGVSGFEDARYEKYTDRSATDFPCDLQTVPSRTPETNRRPS
jgi:hypothetical protein